MANPDTGSLIYNDSFTQKEKVYEDILRTSRVYAPFTMNHMKQVSEMHSKIQWFHQAISQGTVTLSSAYTAGAGSFTVTAPSNYNPFDNELKASVSYLRTEDGSATYEVTAVNAAYTSITVTLSTGSDANLASGAKLYIIRKEDIGGDFGAQNDTATATTDINYITNFTHTISIANPVADGSFQHFGQNELSYEQQLANKMPEIIRMIERGGLKGERTQGSNPATSGGFTRTAGTGSEAGGVTSFISSGGGYSTTGSAISEDILETDLIQLRDRGAFSAMSSYDRDLGVPTCDVYLSETMLGDLNKLVRLERPAEKTLSSQSGGTFGTWCYEYLINGIKCKFYVSDAASDTELIYVPNKENIELRIMRLAEQQPERNDGDNTKRLYATTFSLCAKAPWTLGTRTGMSRL